MADNLSQLILDGVTYKGTRDIGLGAYARVFEVDYQGTLCAAKEIHALKLQYAQGDELQKIKEDFIKECQIWSTLRHPCIVQFLGIYYPMIEQPGLPVMVMEKMQQSLKNLINHSQCNDIPLLTKLSILEDVSLGLRYLHTRTPPIVHRDLTPNNILLGHHLNAKITDLGVAKVIQNTGTQSTMTPRPGTSDFMPPECLIKKPVYNASLDIFSYGGVIIYTAIHQWPSPDPWVQFDSNNENKRYLSEVQRRQRYLDQMTESPADLNSLAVSCLDDNPKKRPLIEEVSEKIKNLRFVAVSDNANEQQLQHELQSLQHEQLEIQMFAKLREKETIIEKMRTESTVLKDKIRSLTTEVHQLKLALQDNSNSTTEITKITWEEGAAMPVKRAYHTAVWLSELIYLGGGYEPDQYGHEHGSYRIDIYNPVENSWGCPISSPQSLFAMTVVDNHLIIAGGEDKVWKITDKLIVMENDQLKEYTTLRAPRKLATAFSHEKMLIVVGGEDERHMRLSTTELLDINTEQWYVCSDLPQPHYWLQSVILDNTVYLLGGLDQGGNYSPMVFAASLETLCSHQLKWTSSINTPWCSSTPLCISHSRLVVVGGVKETNETTKNKDKLTTTIFHLNKPNHIWEAIGDIPLTRHAVAAVSLVNGIIIFGGNNTSRKCTDNVWISFKI